MGATDKRVAFLACSQNAFFFDEYCFSDATTVSTEVTSYIKDLRIGRFDILIEDAQNRCVCIIENKIFAGEQPEQLSRYSDWLSIEREGWKTFLVFLTLDGHDSTTIKGIHYTQLAYCSKDKDNNKPSIASWLGECVEEVKKEQTMFQHLCSALEQYKNHIENIAKGEMAMNEGIIEEIRGHMASAQAIFDNYRDACLRCANDILCNQVLRGLKQRDPENEWDVKGSCNFNKGQEGVWFLRKSKNLVDPEAEHGHIFVIFGATHLSQCQVAIWQDCKNEKNLINLERGTEDDKIVNELGGNWSVTYGKVNWPVWRGVKDPNDNSGSSYLGMDWNGEFFDKMKSKDYSENVINDIVDSILKLYNFQTEYGKLHPLS